MIFTVTLTIFEELKAYILEKFACCTKKTNEGVGMERNDVDYTEVDDSGREKIPEKREDEEEISEEPYTIE
jgi:hypothetical protein